MLSSGRRRLKKWPERSWGNRPFQRFQADFCWFSFGRRAEIPRFRA